MSRSVSRCELFNPLSAGPMPSHAVRFSRVCVQAKTQGIARRVSTPPVGRRFAGRLPTLREAISISGAARDQNTKRKIVMKKVWHQTSDLVDREETK